MMFYSKTHTKLHLGSNCVARMSQLVLMQQRLASLMFSWFIQAVTNSATQDAAIPQQENLQHNKIHGI
jgi:hypothetical protein